MLRRIYFFITLTALALAGPGTSPRTWELSPTGLNSVQLPADAVAITAPTQADLDGDGLPEKLVISDSGQAVISSGAKLRWQSPQAWQVRQALIADLNQDGRMEAVLLVWRPFKPWPVDTWLPNGGRINSFHNAEGLSCHLILIGWYQNEFRERWAGSALAEPIQTFAVADLSGSGKQSLITLEGSYDAPPGSPADQLKVWEWNGFGFRVVSKIAGTFSNLVITHSGDGHAIIVAP